jgi:hypothetical protein
VQSKTNAVVAQLPESIPGVSGLRDVD